MCVGFFHLIYPFRSPLPFGKHVSCPSLWIYFFANQFIWNEFLIPPLSDITWWLALFSTIISGSIHVAEKGLILFFFMAKIPLSLFFLIHSSVHGHFGHSGVLVTVNSAVVNTGGPVSCLQIHPRCGIPDQLVALFSVSWGIAVLFSMWLFAFKDTVGVPFPHILFSMYP